MKKFLFLFLLSGLSLNIYSQLKVVSGGNVGVGISYPNHSFHVWGFSQCFNYNSKEIQFRARDQSGNLFHSVIGSNLGNIFFWHSGWGYNTLTRGACVSNSDQRIKRNITSLTNALSVVRQLNPKKYQYVDSIIPGGKYHYGFLAQQVAEHIHEIVDSAGKYGFLTLNYEEIIPFLAGAIKEQALTIDSLREEVYGSGSRKAAPSALPDSLKQLKNQMLEMQRSLDEIRNSCCQKTNANADKNSEVAGSGILTNNELLLQNVPNPFDNTTLIKYKIPAAYSGRSVIKLFDLKGEEKASYEISREAGELTVSAGSLVAGMYLYSLIVNNDILATRQMIIAK